MVKYNRKDEIGKATEKALKKLETKLEIAMSLREKSIFRNGFAGGCLWWQENKY